MKTIYKYELKEIINYVFMPVNAKILSLQMQGDIPCIWAEVENNNNTEPRIFIIFGTGHEIKFKDEYLKFINTVQQGFLVWHIYEYTGSMDNIEAQK